MSGINILGMLGGLGKGSAQANSAATAASTQSLLTGNLLSGFANVLNAFDIKNSTLSDNQKKMAQADNGVNLAADAASFIPGIGPALGLGIKALNTLGGQFIKTPKDFKNFAVNQDVASTSAFSGTVNGATSALSDINAFKGSGLAGKLFGKKDLRADIKESNRQQKVASGITKENANAQANMGSANMFSTRTNTNQAGVDYTAIKYGSSGMKLTKDISKLLVKSFEKGGSLQKNVIVNGALHAHKHTLKNVKDFKDAAITHKGVPVITKSEGGEIIQHAEVEKDEIILHHSLTEKLEELRSLGTEEAMVEAGRILAKELIKNTKDSKSKLLK
jgi:hypothetical protein